MEVSALIAGITQCVKQIGVPAKYLPLIAILAGVIVKVSVEGPNIDAMVSGMAIALGVTGGVGVVKDALPKITKK